MPPISRKRRAPVDEEEDEIATPTQSQRNRGEESPVDEEDDEEGDEQESGSGSLAQLSKCLVRYALACEYSRIPIRRQDVGQKVLGSHSRAFKQVFEAANAQLMDTFGMEMVELPNKEKVTTRQKRAAAASESQPKNSNQWVLRSTLPDKFRIPDIISPPSIPTSEVESAYVGLYTMIISLISLSGGTLSESRLDRFLKRMNADQSTPVDSTPKLLAKMIKDGYIVRVKDNSAGEETIDYVVGSRGKVEVGDEGVMNFVRTVYGDDAMEDLDQRLNRSLGIIDGGGVPSQLQPPANEQGAGRRRPGRPRRRGHDDEGDDE
ncbi:MAGE-domain-containing protein [Lojkania enalia]|uniref:MAGE-domain-containing protein n=1 Tax=Lojkania enalia TaxID=147567 RepID=A0A9P4N6P9_9PLEO|nr:MAGE-domain-containing protein [Didymosphaeria enalia]